MPRIDIVVLAAVLAFPAGAAAMPFVLVDEISRIIARHWKDVPA
jgi:hypothetical protein